MLRELGFRFGNGRRLIDKSYGGSVQIDLLTKQIELFIMDSHSKREHRRMKEEACWGLTGKDAECRPGKLRMAVAAATLLLGSAVVAAAYPRSPIKLVVPRRLRGRLGQHCAGLR